MVSEEREIERQVREMILYASCTDAPKKPGAWMKRYGYNFSMIKKFKSKHFQHRIK
jgi:hypothetical protein